MTPATTSRLALAAALVAFAAAAVPAIAQPKGPQNLQVLPKDIERGQLIGIMKGFSAALGVECTYCHVGTDRASMDFPSDAKKEKHAARAMMKMVHAINADTFKIADMKDAKVTCFTCHRGSVKPLTKPDAPAS